MTSTIEKKIEVTVSPDGAVSIKTVGFVGGSCRDATRDLERALGVSGRDRLLPEFYAQTGAAERLRQSN